MINNRQNGRRRGRGGPQVRNGAGNGSDRGNRIDNRARGNAAQLHEKYKNLARDAQMQGDRVMTEYYLQFADHYFRVLGESRQRFEEQNQQRRPRDDFDYDDGDRDDNDGEEGEFERPAPARREPRADRRYEPAPEPVAAPAANGAEAPIAADTSEEGEARRNRRGRRSRRPEGGDEQPRLEMDRLPPAFSEAEPQTPPLANGHAAAEAPGEGGDEPAPKKRRTRRVVKEGGDSVAAA
ncbi:DUF4167 domain-containing protein [Sphingomonas morindae]|uniref:DUF4167 domain-containing protein n=1 Tax=Sphingomonas morindae TaxID=1541170 RepID=A0ABY4XB46_9SPHN|nr:DUF4167 domain-containing protein [Sphingomonas morindae]USI74138.1 DUF4167 domain-containing protein [Sphingomonas morindae]